MIIEHPLQNTNIKNRRILIKEPMRRIGIIIAPTKIVKRGKSMKSIARKVSMIFLLAFFISLVPKEAQAASYPLVFFFEDAEFEKQTISIDAAVGDTIPIRMLWYPEYKNEGYDVAVISYATGKTVATASNTFTNISNNARKFTINWNTKNVPAGEYKAEVTKKFYSLYQWNTAPTVSRFFISLHIWDKGKVTLSPTCAKEGEKTFTCTKCGKTKKQILSKTTNHKYDTGSVTKAATCTEIGIRTFTCSVCGDTYTKDIPALGHNFGEWTITVSPTCTTAGSKERTCSRCSEKETAEVPITHSWDDGVVETPPTCTDTCTLCGETKKETIPANGHTWDAGIVTKKATTSAAGVKTFTCTVCGQERTESIAKLPIPVLNPVLGNLTTLSSKAKALSENADPAGSTFCILQVKGKKIKKTSIKIAWKAVPKATGYVVYGAPCGSKYVKLTDVKATSYTQSGLNKGKYYKYFVSAHDKNGNIQEKKKTVHIATSGGKKGNTKSVKLNKKKVTLKKGKKVKLKATLKNGNLKVSKHRKVVFESDNPRVATVSNSGKVKAVGAGKCTIYAYAQNGVFAKCKVT